MEFTVNPEQLREFYSLDIYINEACKSEGNIRLPYFNRIKLDTSINGWDVYLGFDCLLNLENRLSQIIPEERNRNGTNLDLDNFSLRTGTSLKQLIIFIHF